MTPSQWTRQASRVHAVLQVQPDHTIVTSKPLAVYIPERFLEKGLAKLGDPLQSIGIFAMVVEDRYYAVCTVNAMMRFKPTAVRTVKFDGVAYLELSFAAGSVVVVDDRQIVSDTIVYQIFDTIISYGKVPWYLDYNDLAKLFQTADLHAGVKLGRSHAILEMFASAISRVASDRTLYYRHSITSQDMFKVTPPSIISLRSITYGATNTTAKLMGSYWSDGLTSALVNPSDRVEAVEELLRR